MSYNIILLLLVDLILYISITSDYTCGFSYWATMNIVIMYMYILSLFLWLTNEQF